MLTLTLLKFFIYKTFAASQLPGSVSPHFACSIWWRLLASDFGTSSRHARSRVNLILTLPSAMRSCSKEEDRVHLNNFSLESNKKKSTVNKGLVFVFMLFVSSYMWKSLLGMNFRYSIGNSEFYYSGWLYRKSSG